MKLSIERVILNAPGHLGPMCIACGNTRQFWIHTPEGDSLLETTSLPKGEIKVRACGKCRSHNSIVVAHVD